MNRLEVFYGGRAIPPTAEDDIPTNFTKSKAALEVDHQRKKQF